MRRFGFSLLLLIGFAVLMGYLSYLTPWVGDDIEYAYKASPDGVDMTDVPVRTFADVIESQRIHYFSVNGRSLTHTVAQGFCALWGRPAFAAGNALAYALFALLLCAVAKLPVGKPRPLFCTILLIGLGFNTSLSPVCQVTYIWAYCLALAFLLLMRRPHALPIVLGIPVAFAAGWGHESLNLGLCGALLSALLWRQTLSWRRTEPTTPAPTWAQWLLAAAFCGGTLLIVLSPAAWSRAADTHVAATTSLLNFVRFQRLCPLLLVCLLAGAVWRPRQVAAFLKSNAFFVTAWMLLIGFNFAVGIFGPRQLFGIETLSLLLLLRLFAPLLASGNTPASADETTRRWFLRGRTLLIGTLTFAATLTLLRRHAFILQTREAYERTMSLCRIAPDGACVAHTFARGDEAWPGDQFLGTMEKQVKTQTGKTLHIVPANRLH